MHCCQCVISINATFIKLKYRLTLCSLSEKVHHPRKFIILLDMFALHVGSKNRLILYKGLFIGDNSHAVLISKNGLMLHQFERQVREIFFESSPM